MIPYSYWLEVVIRAMSSILWALNSENISYKPNTLMQISWLMRLWIYLMIALGYNPLLRWSTSAETMMPLSFIVEIKKTTQPYKYSNSFNHNCSLIKLITIVLIEKMSLLPMMVYKHPSQLLSYEKHSLSDDLTRYNELSQEISAIKYKNSLPKKILLPEDFFIIFFHLESMNLFDCFIVFSIYKTNHFIYISSG